MRGRHVPAARAEAPLREGARRDAERGQRAAHVEDGEAFPSLAAGGQLHGVHGQDHRAGWRLVILALFWLRPRGWWWLATVSFSSACRWRKKLQFAICAFLILFELNKQDLTC